MAANLNGRDYSKAEIKISPLMLKDRAEKIRSVDWAEADSKDAVAVNIFKLQPGAEAKVSLQEIMDVLKAASSSGLDKGVMDMGVEDIHMVTMWSTRMSKKLSNQIEMTATRLVDDTVAHLLGEHFCKGHDHPAFTVASKSSDMPALAEDATRDEVADSLHALLDAGAHQHAAIVAHALKSVGIDVQEHSIDQAGHLFMKASTSHRIESVNTVMSGSAMRQIMGLKAAVIVSNSGVMDVLKPWSRRYLYENGRMRHYMNHPNGEDAAGLNFQQDDERMLNYVFKYRRSVVPMISNGPGMHFPDILDDGFGPPPKTQIEINRPEFK